MRSRQVLPPLSSSYKLLLTLSVTLLGFTITPSELLTRVESYVTSNLSSIAPTNWSSIGKTLGQMKLVDGLRWVAPLELKASVEEVFEAKFGSKEEAMKKEKEKQAAAKKVQNSLPCSPSPSLSLRFLTSVFRQCDCRTRKLKLQTLPHRPLLHLPPRLPLLQTTCSRRAGCLDYTDLEETSK